MSTTTKNYQHLKLTDTKYRLHKGDKYGSKESTTYSLEADGLVLEIPRKLALAFAEYITQAEIMRNALGEEVNPTMDYNPSHVGHTTEASITSFKYSAIVVGIQARETEISDVESGAAFGSNNLTYDDSQSLDDEEKQIDILHKKVLYPNELKEKKALVDKALHDMDAGNESTEKEIYLEKVLELQNGRLKVEIVDHPVLPGLVGEPNSDEDNQAQNEQFALKWLDEHKTTKSADFSGVLNEGETTSKAVFQTIDRHNASYQNQDLSVLDTAPKVKQERHVQSEAAVDGDSIIKSFSKKFKILTKS